MMDVLAPFVYWAQTESQVTLKVDLTDVKDLNVDVDEKKLKVTAHGQGARGPNNYGFSLDLHSEIIPEETDYKVIDRQVDFLLKKKNLCWWPRLICQPQKPPWIRIDFDRWKSEDMDDNEEATRDICNDYPDMYDKLHKEELGYRKEDLKTVYLIIYNLCQFIGFLYILSVTGIRYTRDGQDFMKETYATVGNPMKFIQLLQFLEVMHPMFGYTKGSTLVSFAQTGGRSFVLFCMIEAEPRMQTKPAVFYLFVVWSLIEVVRYPYYITQLLHVDVPLLKWLRYTLWIPLYPLGFLCEGVIILRNIPYFEETQRFTVSMPNKWNFTLHFPWLMRIYLILMTVVTYFLLSHMNDIRRKKLRRCNVNRKGA